MDGAKHVCLSADASTRSYKETLAGLLYSWRTNPAVYPRAQYIQAGRDVLEAEDDLSSLLAASALERKLERVAAYRQLQACSNMLTQVLKRSFG